MTPTDSTDPAEAAARRACSYFGTSYEQIHSDSCMVDAAREALKPIREWYEDPARGFSELQSLIYAEEEL